MTRRKNRASPYKPLCGQRVGKLSARARAALPDKAFGLPESRDYPMPDAQHAAYALALAKANLARGALTKKQHARIVRKARRMLRECDAVEIDVVGNPSKRDLEAIARAVQTGAVQSGDTVQVVDGRRLNPTDARQAYTAFHWGNAPRKTKRVKLPSYRQLYALGKLRQVEYETVKGRQHAIWYHDFKKPYPTLTATPDGQLGPIVGGGAVVTPRGIER